MIEQRSAQRFVPENRLFAKIRPHGYDDAFICVPVQNISKKGVCVDTLLPIPAGESFQIQFSQDGGFQTSHFDAHLVWQKKESMAFMFRLNQSEGELENILHHIQSKLS